MADFLAWFRTKKPAQNNAAISSHFTLNDVFGNGFHPTPALSSQGQLQPGNSTVQPIGTPIQNPPNLNPTNMHLPFTGTVVNPSGASPNPPPVFLGQLAPSTGNGNV